MDEGIKKEGGGREAWTLSSLQPPMDMPPAMSRSCPTAPALTL